MYVHSLVWEHFFVEASLKLAFSIGSDQVGEMQAEAWAVLS